jgi:hypothetical protein
MNFGNEDGEAVSVNEIQECFVEQESFSKFKNPTNTILVATAKKGVGKSALLRWLDYTLASNEDYLVIPCRGRDLVRSNFPLKGEPKTANEFINDWMIRLCTLINRELAKTIKFAGDDDTISVIEAAEIDGFKKKNLISALTDRLTGILGNLKRDKPEIGNQIELLKRLSKKTVWILLDDLDATYQRTDRENLELSTFFSACRYLTAEVHGVIFRVTMRTDVWPMIRRYDEALDKTEQYVNDITWSQADFRQLLYRRIDFQAKALGIEIPDAPRQVETVEKEEYYINLVFEKRMPWGDHHDSRTYKILYTLSYHRPRWAIQLCKLAQKEAIARRAEVIERADIDSVWGIYGKKRIEDLIVEHKHQSKDIEEIINSFRGAERRMKRDDLLLWIKNKITEHMTPVIERKPTKDPVEIAHFLYRIGFLQARIETGDNYEHYFFSDMPDFLTSRTNNDFDAIWEIHPCYREALDIVKLNRWQAKNRNMAR